MHKHARVFAELAAPFEPAEVKTRSQAGREFTYITARTAMNRLDAVLGPDGWKDEFRETAHGAIFCRIWFRLPGETEWLWKEDGGGVAGMQDPGDDAKSGFSDAFKRTAVKLGVGRYLYRDGVPDFEGDGSTHEPNPVDRRRDHPPARQSAPPASSHRPGKWGSAAGPGVAVPTPNDDPEDRDAPAQGRPPLGNLPRNGRALFAWLKHQEQDGGHSGLFERVAKWGKKEGHPMRLVDWTEDETAAACNYALEAMGLVEPMET
jgi:hypothetical protein